MDSNRHPSLRPLKSWVGALVKWLWVMTHVQEVVGLNPSAIHWMDIFRIDLF